MIEQTEMPFMKPIKQRCWVIAAMVLLTCFVTFQDTYAQDFGGIGGGQDTGSIEQLQQLQQSQVGGGSSTGTSGTSVGGGEIETFTGEDAVLSGTNEDVRNQGFVGATGTRIEELGFVGPAGEISGPPLAEGASFGGGVNDAAATGSFGGGNARRNQQTGFGAIGQGKGFQVIRKGVRTSLTPRFASPTYSTAEISNRFNNRIRRQPVIQNDGGGLVVSINNRVATVSGYAKSEAECNRFIRQLRLEPGIDHINDQISRQ